MENPWEKLPSKGDFVLPDDVYQIKEFNQRMKTKLDNQIQCDGIFPEPYLGNPDAPVVILNLNPSFNDKNKEEHKKREFAEKSRRNLLHEPAEYPIYLLDPVLDYALGAEYWNRMLRQLIVAVGDNGTQLVANGLFCVEFFPYHSKKFGWQWQRDILPSQHYNFKLVRKAIEQNALILIMRGEKKWFMHVDGLEKYKQRYTANSWLNPVISLKNFNQGFEQAVKEIQSFQTTKLQFSTGLNAMEK
jgi:hypothetical protein